MNSMFSSRPDEEDLRNRILRQLEWRGKSKVVALIWRGYLAALLEWGGVDPEVYDRLSSLLPDEGSSELFELFGDEKNSPEQEEEIKKISQGGPFVP
jgi:hypothetical protein